MIRFTEPHGFVALISVSPDGWLSAGDFRVRCALGRGGVVADKREGDGATPSGLFPLRALWYRTDKMALPDSGLPRFPITPNAGWCDDPMDPAYNRPVLLPFAASHERMWRDDGLYDLVVPLGHNDDPVVPGHGSAIFLHVARPDYGPTEGCVALGRDDLLMLLARCGRETRMRIEP